MEAPAEPTSNEKPGGRSLFVEIVQNVAEVRGLDPLEMPRLAEQIDLDALDRLFEQDSRLYSEPRGTLAFTYAGCAVEVHSNGTLDVEPIDERRGVDI